MSSTGRVSVVKLTHWTFFWASLTCILAFSALFFSAVGSAKMSLLLVASASVTLLIFGKFLTKNYTSFLVIFLTFSLLYGLSGPLSTLYGENLSPLFTQPYETSFFLFNYSLAVAGITLGMVILSMLPFRHKPRPPLQANYRLIAILAVTFAALASSCEIVNFFRVGGISTLGHGKAVYQSSVGSLTLTLPSYGIALLAFSLISLAHVFPRNKLGSSRSLSKYVLLFILTISPLFVITVMLGKRGPLVAWLLAILVGITYFRPIRRLSGKIMLILLIFYIGLSFIFANRWLVTNTVLTGDWSRFFSQAFRFERVVKFLNPGANEFGSAFGNFSEYSKSGDSISIPGVTYVTALIGPIPSFLYPGEKPQQITYEFRDKFFPSEAVRSRIAGTGFSSILEAYMNFGVLGVFGVYFLVGIVLVLIERVRVVSQSPDLVLFYLLMLPLAQKFHRSSFGSVVNTILWATILIVVFRFCYTVFVCIVKVIQNNQSCLPSREQAGYDTV